MSVAVEMYPQIEIDHERCTTPFACKKCLQVCPTAVLIVFNVKMERLVETDPNDPGTYRVGVAYRDKCTACDLCIGVCPVDAIKVFMPEVVS